MVRNSTQMVNKRNLYQGLFVDVIEELSKILDFRYELEVLHTDDHVIGHHRSRDSHWNRLAEHLNSGVSYCTWPTQIGLSFS